MYQLEERRATLGREGLWRGNVAVQAACLDLLPEPWDGDSGAFSGQSILACRPLKDLQNSAVNEGL